MKKIRFFVPIFMLLAIVACNKEDQNFRLQPVSKDGNGDFCINSKTVKIAVLSDLHLMDPSLLKADGTAFQMYLMQDPKLLAESSAILQQIIHNLLIEKPDLVLISGDLTKDGELVSHKSVIKQLQILSLNHIKVLVIPGNHDINNPDAKLFNGDNTVSVPTITPENFKSLYADFGYKTAIAKDPNSLSYVSEPFKDLRILALDANEYYNNTPQFCVVAGNIKDATMQWAKKQLADASAKGKTVIGMMHHGIVEHFMGESVIFPDYLVDNWGARADEFIKAGLKVMFTGHFHANDATQRTLGNLSLVDIETGSPVIYASPYRIINLVNNKLYIKTKHIEHINYPGLNGVSFPDYEKAFSFNGFEIQAKYMLMNAPYNVPEDVATQISPVFAESMMAHFAGDETLSTDANEEIEAISAISPDLANIIYGLYTDLPPKDNDLIVDLN
ncbi:MAG: metallophosphoesterase [Bacteroidales bacterium]